jgi:integrase
MRRWESRAGRDFKRNQITVRQSDWQGQIDTPKSGKTRRVPMTVRLAVALQAIRHLRGPRAFYQRNGKLICANTLRSWMQRAQARAGLPLTSGVHILRHTFCSHLAMRGAPVRAIQELAGHADLSTTKALHAPVPRVAQPSHPVARAAAAAGRERGERHPSAGKPE